MTIKEKWKFLNEIQKLDSLNNLKVELKKEIRHFYKTHPTRNPLDRIHYTKNYDSYWTLTKFPAKDLPYKDEIMESLRLERPNSLYDCTGAKFTIIMDSFILKDGSFFIYHLVGIDI